MCSFDEGKTATVSAGGRDFEVTPEMLDIKEKLETLNGRHVSVDACPDHSLVPRYHCISAGKRTIAPRFDCISPGKTHTCCPKTCSSIFCTDLNTCTKTSSSIQLLCHIKDLLETM